MSETPVILLGFGNVGQSVAKLIDRNQGYRHEGVRLRLQAVFDRSGGIVAEGYSASALVEAKRGEGSVRHLSGAAPVELPWALESNPGAVLVDTSITDAASGEPGLRPARRALEGGHSVVFASKGPLVVAQSELSELARSRGARLGISAAVGIPLPSVEVGILGLRGAHLHRFRGVFNDTTNQILRDLEAGVSLDESIERARVAGTIEEDPRLDLDGWDAAYKLLILSRAIWDVPLSLRQARVTGVGAIGKTELEEARSRGKRIRLIATGARDASGTIHLKTEPEPLGAEDPLYDLGPGEKGVVFETEAMGTVTLRTSKAGPEATAACALKDILNVSAPRRPFA